MEKVGKTEVLSARSTHFFRVPGFNITQLSSPYTFRS